MSNLTKTAERSSASAARIGISDVRATAAFHVLTRKCYGMMAGNLVIEIEFGPEVKIT